jgi:hypothetical protein
MSEIDPQQQELFLKQEMESRAPASFPEMAALYEKARKLGKLQNSCKKADDASQRIPLIGITGYQLLWIAITIPIIIIICIFISGRGVWIGDLIADCVLGLLAYFAMRGIFIDFPSFGFAVSVFSSCVSYSFIGSEIFGRRASKL